MTVSARNPQKIALPATGSYTIDQDGTRDDHIRSGEFLEVESYPTLAFRSERRVQDGDTWILNRILTVHGCEPPLVLEVTTSTVRDTSSSSRQSDQSIPRPRA